MLDAIIISDLHLGSDNSQAPRLCELLERIESGELATSRLILNGDVFDSIDFRRLKKHHWRVLSLLRKLSDRVEIVWIAGNHDGSAETISHLLGVKVVDEYVFESGGRRVLCLHGHTFDDFLYAHPFLGWLGDCIYAFLQWIDKSHRLAKIVKRQSKLFLRNAQKIREKALVYAARKGCYMVCCGHTHHPFVSTQYCNSGCWTELPGTYLTVLEGVVSLHSFVSLPSPPTPSSPSHTLVNT